MEQVAVSAWVFAVIGGPIILGIALAWLIVRNRRARRGRDAPPGKSGGDSRPGRAGP